MGKNVKGEGKRVRPWGRGPEVAGVPGREARADYLAVARFMRRREPAGYAAVRLLTPRDFQPHVLAGYAFASFTDDVCDHGTVEERTRRFDAWAGRVRDALDTGRARHPLLRAFLRTSELGDLPRSWIEAYLAGARIDLDFTGFRTEADYQRYIDQLTWPFLMLTLGLAHDGGGSEEFAAACRPFADAGQRVDILTDLAEDLREGRLYLPESALDRHGVTRADLEQARPTPGVRALIAEIAESARAALRDSTRFVDGLDEEHRGLGRFVLDLHHQRLDRVVALGADAARRPVRDDPLACARLLARSRRATRTARQAPSGRRRSARRPAAPVPTGARQDGAR